jgi:drug/metabolite transporter (DMT)-like permease
MVMTILGSIAAIFLKRAAVSRSFTTLMVNKNLYIGAILYGISAVINIYALRKLDYFLVLPITSLSYIWTLFLSHILLKEPLSIRKCTAIGGIISGVLLSLLPGY